MRAGLLVGSLAAPTSWTGHVTHRCCCCGPGCEHVSNAPALSTSRSRVGESAADPLTRRFPDACVAAGFYGSDVIELCQLKDGYNSVGLRKAATTRPECGVPRGDAKYEAAAHRFCPRSSLRCRHALSRRVEATSMAEAEQQSTMGEQQTIVARGCALGVNAECAK